MNEKENELNKGSFLYINDKEKAEWGYPEGYPYKEQTKTEFAILGKVTLVNDQGRYTGTVYVPETFSVDEKYIVIFDGESYIVTVMEDDNAWAVGNLLLAATGTQVGNGVPFFIQIIYDDDFKKYAMTITALPTETNIHTVEIYTFRENIHTIYTEYLPEGYPYTEAAEIVCAETTVENGASIKNPLSTMLTAGYKYKVVHNDISYECIAYESTFDGYPCVSIGNMSLHSPSLSGGNGEPFVFASIPLFDLSIGGFSEIGNHTFSIERSEIFYPIAAEFLPLATPTIAGTVKQAAAVADVTAAPTAEEFNALLKSLRDAGILATS